MTVSSSDARAIWDAGVAAVDPAHLIRRTVRCRGSRLIVADREIDTKELRRIVVVGAGKASGSMAAALEDVLGPERLLRWDVQGLVNVPEDLVRPLRRIVLHPARPSGRNEPTMAGVVGSAAISDFLATVGRRDVVIALLSGGGSALLPSPAPGLPFADKQAITSRLLAVGATIQEMNAVRKHLSTLKGGGMARNFRGLALVSLILSDVVGDPLDVIASGPTSTDPTTFSDAIAVLMRHGLWETAPHAVRVHLERGRAGGVPETLARLPRSVSNHLIGSNRHALDAASAEARRRGYSVLDLGARLTGETRDVAGVLAGIVRSAQRDGVPGPTPLAILSGGETTVRLDAASGRGGRNQEMSLALGYHLGDDLAGIRILCAGTDGEDGPTDAAGARMDSTILARARRLGLDLSEHLVRHDAYPFFDATKGLVRTGLTGTNVMDLRVILVGHASITPTGRTVATSRIRAGSSRVRANGSRNSRRPARAN